MTSRANTKTLFKYKTNTFSGKQTMEKYAMHFARKLVRHGTHKMVRYITYNSDAYSLVTAGMLLSAIKYHGAIDSSILTDTIKPRFDDEDLYNYIIDYDDLLKYDIYRGVDEYLIKRLFKYPNYTIISDFGIYTRIIDYYAILVRTHTALRFGPGVDRAKYNSDDLHAKVFLIARSAVNIQFHYSLVPFRAILKYIYRCPEDAYAYILVIIYNILQSSCTEVKYIFNAFAEELKKYKDAPQYDKLYYFMYTKLAAFLESKILEDRDNIDHLKNLMASQKRLE